MTYEYSCQACSHHWEAEQSIRESPLKTCPKCGAEAAKRLVSGGTGFLLKGGGWYSDGYGSVKPKADGASTSGANSSSTASSDKPSESNAPSKSDAPKKSDASAASTTATKAD
jgi:putative FmdB family regulatory protein